MDRAGWRRHWALAASTAWLLLACGDVAPGGGGPNPSTTGEGDAGSARYVGADACGDCHAEALRRWRGSHHDLAMQEASPESVLGDFSGASLSHHGQSFRFERDADRFVIHAADADGTLRDFPVAYTFGVEPLQQYLVERPGGRLHAVASAFDTRPASAGGQRWLHLPEDQAVPPGDVLHWTGLAGSWNANCADCHSTGMRKGYEPGSDTYAPRWASPDVSCEACHGPASRHLEWAKRDRGEDLEEDPTRGLAVRSDPPHAWTFVEGEPIARRVPAASGESVELDTCAPCHSRRSRIAAADAPGPFLDAYQPALIEPGLYFPDGQIREEVYVWGSFVQSRMHAAGVVCSDCHDPHALRIDQPDAACARCHRREVFAIPAHHHHAADSPGASCVACHMPARTYMAVDDRRDHGFRIPRPDLTVALGVPNPCADCHARHGPEWAAAATERWRAGRPGRGRHFGEVFDAARRGRPGALAELAGLAADRTQPAIVRASALRRLGTTPAPAAVPALRDALRDEEPLVRSAAAGAAEGFAAEVRLAGLLPRLRDPMRAVRIEAARVLAPLAPRIADARAQRDLAAALAEYRAAQMLAADRPEARTNLGSLAAQQGDLAEARRQYEAATRVGPHFVPAWVSLAEVHRRQGREDAALRVLRAALAQVPDAADVHHALGLLLVRAGRQEDALRSLRRATELAPETSRYAYVYGIALHSAGDEAEAIRVLEATLERHPYDAELLVALATLHRDAGRWRAARGPAARLLALHPDDPDVAALVRQIERAATAPAAGP